MNIFCHICGTNNDNRAYFCSNCGERITEIIDVQKTLLSKLTEDKEGCVCSGIIFTNIAALKNKFNTQNDNVKEVLEWYIDTLKQHGIHYTLIDASDYRYKNPNVSSAYNLVNLCSKDSWLEHSKILTDYYLFGLDALEPKPKYMFIIGGDDVIPTPLIEHYYYKVRAAQGEGMPFVDKDIETDLPYSYLLGDKTFDLLLNNEIFKYEPYFHIGRLPLATDSNIDTLLNYFQRVVMVLDLGGIAIKQAYGQSDITWRKVSSFVAETLHENKLFPDCNCYEDEVCFNKIFTTPHISLNDVDQVFNDEADLFYFNMHGSSAPSETCFMGFDEFEDGERIGGHGFSPNQIAKANKFNVFVSEACYGAKNRKYSTNESMLLTAMAANTMVYLGSSRIAWGAPDSSLINEATAPSLGSADLLCSEFMKAICAGLPAGDALYLARKIYIDTTPTLCYQDAATLVEFNLFGEPILMAYIANKGAKSKRYTTSRIEPLAKKSMKLGCVSEVCYAANDSSILSKVRGLVDKSMLEIRVKIDKYLYFNFNVEPRNLSLVIKNKYECGNEEYEFYYSVVNSLCSTDYVATTDIKGKIKSIYSTK